MKYQSSSKGEVEIAEMATPWLANAFHKIEKQIADGEDGLAEVYAAMNNELVARGCTWNAELANWTFPEAKP